jgi:predicted enzyme related to lactoylglutathione lyase
MNQGVNTIIYPVSDIVKAKALFSNLLGVKPYTDQLYYVGFRIGDQEIGLDPNGHKNGMTVYFDVDNIRQSKQDLLKSGAQIVEDIKDVGRGMLVAIVKDADGNLIVLRQVP